MTERRQFLRFEATLNALCELVSEKWKAVAKVKNISKDGALLALPKPLEEGSEINLSVDVPGDNVPIFASCQVAWQKKPQGSKKKDLYDTGVKFTKMDNADKGKLLEYIYTEWLKLLDRT